MNKVLNFNQAIKVADRLHQAKQKIVLAGGVFDLLHYGHLKFLQKAKKQGDILIVALETDNKVKQRKGNHRPINPVRIRSEILAALSVVDYVLILPEMKNDADYFKMVEKIKPAIIAVTQKDPQIENKRRQAKAVGGKIVIVTPKIPTLSTTQLAKILEVE